MTKYGITSLLILLFASAFGQNEVIDVSFLKPVNGIKYFPDVEGKVVVEPGFYQYLFSEEGRDEVPVFEGWPMSFGGSNECGGVYGNLDDDPDLEIIYPVGSLLYALNIDRSAVDGWPKTLDFPTDGAASYGDIDGDGEGEIVVTTHQVGSFAFGTLYAFEADGSDVPGFPVPTEGGGVRTPALADLDADGALEIIITVRDWPDGLVYVFSGNGSIYPGWPVRMDYVPGSSAAVSDINSDGVPEIVAESYYGLHVFNPDGGLLEGFPYYPGLGRVFSYSAPVLADLDGDGNREIICGDHSIENGTGAVHIVENDGNSWLQWPKFTTSWVYGPPSVGDIDNDGQLDIAVGDQTLSSSPVNQVYAWTALTGEPLQGFPIAEVFGINSQIILADLDGDLRIELLTADNTATGAYGQYPGFNHDGTRMDDWLLKTLGSTFFINPLVFDINNDGILDISGGGTDPGENATSIYLWNAGVDYVRELAVLPILQYNTRHNGVYGDVFMVGMEEGGKGNEQKRGIVLYPDPASSFITIRFTEIEDNLRSEDLQFTVYDLAGNALIKSTQQESMKYFTMDISALASAVYVLSVEWAGGRKESCKFLVY